MFSPILIFLLSTAFLGLKVNKVYTNLFILRWQLELTSDREQWVSGTTTSIESQERLSRV